ncbi:MAG: hypothetical protein QOF76_2295, partial [Solirubrobacteraceae bacterium]|nr:hypothetical protein [Solirubrobacteraceae bacterium]
MNFALTDEQQFLTEAADQALERLKTIEAAREALEGDALDLWPTAVEAGWTGLLVPEEHDGAGLGLAEAQLVLERCGRLLADARLLGHLPASALLPRADLASGAARAAFVDGLDTVTWDGSALTGDVRWVIDAPGADVLVVAARDAGGAPVTAWLAAPPVAAGERSPGDAPVTV